MLFFNFFEYGLAVLLLNIYVYIILVYLFFNVLFIFNFFKLKSLNFLKIFNKFTFINITLFLTILSMAGVPPLLGFFGKFLLFNFFFLKNNILFLIIFSFLNFFSIYFYIQNLRFLISKTQQNYWLVVGYYVFFNINLINIIVFLNLLNFFGILYFEDILYFFLNILTYKNII